MIAQATDKNIRKKDRAIESGPCGQSTAPRGSLGTDVVQTVTRYLTPNECDRPCKQKGIATVELDTKHVCPIVFGHFLDTVGQEVLDSYEVYGLVTRRRKKRVKSE